MKKKRNKKYKPKSPLVRLYSWESERTASDEFVNAMVKMSFGWIDVDGKMSFNLTKQSRNWTLILRTILWYPDGNVDIKTAVTHERGVKLDDLEELSKKMRCEVIKTSKLEHIVDIGWIAQTFDKTPNIGELDEYDMGEITEERQMLWNASWNEEVKQIVA